MFMKSTDISYVLLQADEAHTRCLIEIVLAWVEIFQASCIGALLILVSSNHRYTSDISTTKNHGFLKPSRIEKICRLGKASARG